MKIRKVILALVPTVLGAEAFFAAASPEVKIDAKGFTLSNDSVTVAVRAVTDNVVRVAKYVNGGQSPAETQAMAAPMPPESVTVTVTPSGVTMTTATSKIDVDKSTGDFVFADMEGKVLAYGSPDKFVAEGSPSLYGGGERGHKLRLNGDTLRMYNRQNYGYTGSDPRISQMGITMPLLVGDNGLGVVYDDFTPGNLEAGPTISYTADNEGNPAVYLINGQGSLAGGVQALTELTGRQGLPPFWSLGYITSKYGYHTQAETTGVIDTLKRHDFPVDGVVLDLYWYGKETDMGRLEWNREQFPEPEKMMAALRAQGVKTVLISQPYINKIGAIDNYNLLSDASMLVRDAKGDTHDVTTWVGDAGMLDVSNPETRRWLWCRYRDLTEGGVEGWWGDLGEPEVHPLTIVHDNGLSAADYHNVYGNEWSRLIYEGLRKDFPDRRALLLMRGGTTGLQRYSVFPWSTDVSRSWGGMEPQVRIMLNSGLSGLGYMSSDIGGFAVDPANPTDAELYVRWLQMGTFTPMLRTHAQQKPEPYNYPEIEDIARRFVKMRYEWLPYNYTLAYENAVSGAPLVRPLNFSGSVADAHLDNIGDEYLWGESVLVAPVFERGARWRKVLFPAGEWVDWYNPTVRYKGGTEHKVKAPLEQIPLFVKSGSFIPQYTEPIENTDQYDPSRLTVKYFPSEQLSNYTLYDDDRKSPDSLEDENYTLTTFTGVKSGKELTISMECSGRSYEWMPDRRQITFVVEGLQKPLSVHDSQGNVIAQTSMAEAESGWKYDSSRGELSIWTTWNYAPETITVLYP